jgi:small subunit ribosomal protein S6
VAETPAYDLLVLIDPEAPEERRGAILEAVKKQIDAGDGTLKGDSDWGVRRLAFEIRHRPEAHYHLFQLEAGPDLLKQIRHNLAIDDGVLRHRLIRLDKGVPDKTPTPPVSSRPAPRSDESEALAPVAAAEPAEPVPAAEPAEPVPAAEPAETDETEPQSP